MARTITLALVIVLFLIVLAAGALYFTTRPHIYTDPAHRFTFDLPPGETVEDAPAAEGSFETLIIHGAPGYPQIFIAPWSGPFTLENLEAQYPEVALASAIIPTSLAGSPAFQIAGQMWIVYGGYLYVLDQTLSPIVFSSWRF